MTIEPNTREGIEGYLASGVFPGIGPKTAERIYQKFGDETFEILDQEPEQLLKIKHCQSYKRLKRIKLRIKLRLLNRSLNNLLPVSTRNRRCKI